MTDPDVPRLEGELLERLQRLARARDPVPPELLEALYELTPPAHEDTDAGGRN
jgi:hypothetical protein